MTEAQIQKAVIANLQARGMPGIFFWHNAASRPGPQRDGAGRKIGLPDLMIVRKHGNDLDSYGQLYALELKEPHGSVSLAQTKVLQELHAAGAVVAVKYGLDQALEWLEHNDLLRRAA